MDFAQYLHFDKQFLEWTAFHIFLPLLCLTLVTLIYSIIVVSIYAKKFYGFQMLKYIVNPYLFKTSDFVSLSSVRFAVFVGNKTLYFIILFSILYCIINFIEKVF